MQNQNRPSPTPLLVACLCAGWCGACREYQPLFTQLQEKLPSVRFLWIDIEDEAELVDPIEVENFPTLLVAAPDQVFFFGTVTPHLQTLQRLIQAHQAADRQALAPSPERDSLAKRLWQRLSLGK